MAGMLLLLPHLGLFAAAGLVAMVPAAELLSVFERALIYDRIWLVFRPNVTSGKYVRLDDEK